MPKSFPRHLKQLNNLILSLAGGTWKKNEDSFYLKLLGIKLSPMSIHKFSLCTISASSPMWKIRIARLFRALFFLGLLHRWKSFESFSFPSLTSNNVVHYSEGGGGRILQDLAWLATFRNWQGIRRKKADAKVFAGLWSSSPGVTFIFAKTGVNHTIWPLDLFHLGFTDKKTCLNP